MADETRFDLLRTPPVIGRDADASASTSGGLQRGDYVRLARRAKWLSWASLGYMSLEGLVGLVAGLTAGSIALIGFALDSVIEGLASLVVVWRFTGSRLFSETAERKATRLVALQLFLLVPYIAVEALHDLLQGSGPEQSPIGIALAATSVVLMPALGAAKQRIGRRIGSAATKGEGVQNMLCAYMAGALLIGLAGNAVFGLWWLDPVAALVIAGLALAEGSRLWRGDGCCSGELPGMRSHESCRHE
ncbi:MAG TPA: cation transporter [Actinomycetota bacterium]|jgi:divalent metal cation (Fe/Co/Zn/Cd) transporter|nr:cation transporter [Actinomycetota bacterium]